MKKTRKVYLVTTLVALALAGGQSVYAKADSSDKDSVHNWGPWDKMVSPAAGPEAVNLNPIAFGLPNDYEANRNPRDIRPVPPVVPPPVVPPPVVPPPEPPPEEGFVCPDGALCGYGQTSEWWYNSEYYQDSYDGGEGDMKPWQVALVIDKDGDPAVTDWSADNFPGIDSYENSTYFWKYFLSGAYEYGYVNPNGIINLLGMNLRDQSLLSTGTMPFYYPSDVNFPEEGALAYYYYYIENWTNLSWEIDGGNRQESMYLEVNLTPVLGEESGIYYVYFGHSSRETTYVDCVDGEYCYDNETSEGMYGQFIVGTPSTVAQIDERANAGNVIAHYSGHTFWNGSADVEMTVNFGDSTWSGSWNGGEDGSVWVDSSNNNVYGDVGFLAEGDVVGNGFVSTAVWALDGTVTGKVYGGFFNPKANVVIGVADIVKSRTDGFYSNATHVSTFAAMEGLVKTVVEIR